MFISFPQLFSPTPASTPSTPSTLSENSSTISSLRIKYIESSFTSDSPEMRAICACAKKNNIAALIGADGEIKITRRKIKSTHMERTIFGDGSGASLLNVIDLLGIAKVGGLCCWEHSQPLLRYHTYTQGQEIHVAAWPPIFPHAQTPNALWSTAAEGGMNLTPNPLYRRRLSPHCNAIQSKRTVELIDVEGAVMYRTNGGGITAVYGLDESQISTSTLGKKEEGIVITDGNMEDITRTKHFLNTYGHYSRPDLLWICVDTREKKHIRPQC
ncbi:carbon-nitrogen hydrolase [Halenospora varia]|nr:carbon-nitrogen hydrolase [Halenospora varia]